MPINLIWQRLTSMAFNRSGLLNDVLQILSNTTKSIATVNATN